MVQQIDLSKPARLQVDPDQIQDDDKPPQTGHTFNVWYLQWAGGDPTARDQTKLKFRLDVEKDSGYTRGKDGRSLICLFYSRGCCYRGKNCLYLHRPPKPEDARIATQDCFGRDKTGDYRDDMSGVGSLSRVNKTLYVGGIIATDKIHEQVSKQFLEYGAIDKLKVLPAKKCAFVSFRLEAEAQFTKEAMDRQSLGENDVLTVKWANEDMNPEAQRLVQQEIEAQAIETVKRLLGSDDSLLRSTKRHKSRKNASQEQETVDESQIFDDIPREEVAHDHSEIEHVPIETSESRDGLIGKARLKLLKEAVTRYKEAQKTKATPFKTLATGYTSD